MARFSRHWLRDERTARGLTMKQMAVIVHVTPSAICAWENGEYRPSSHRVNQLKAFFLLNRRGR